MPLCKDCSTPLLLDNGLNEFCANCSGKIVLDKKGSLLFSRSILNKWEKMKYNLIKKYDKWDLTKSALNYRELLSIDLFKSARIETKRLIATDYLLRDVSKLDDFGKTKIDKNSFEKLIKIYGFYCNNIDNIEYIEHDYGLMVLDIDIDSNEIFDKNKLPTERFLYNWSKSRFHFKSEWKSIYALFQSNLIFSKSDGEEYFLEHSKEYQMIVERSRRKKKVNYRSLPVLDYAERYLPTIIQLGCLLRQNEPTEKLYSFIRLNEKIKDPRILMDVCNVGMKYGKLVGSIAKINRKKFLKKFSKFHQDPKNILESMLFSPHEESTPLIVEKGKNLFISPMLMNFITFYLFHIICRDQVETANNKYAEEFEKKTVPDLLEKNGFNINDPKHKGEKMMDRTYKNCGKNGKQFDVIGTKKDCIYVFECKQWGLVPRYFYKYRKKDRLEELEKIYNDQVTRAEFIKNNMDDIGYDKTKFSKVEKVIVLENLGNVPTTKYKDMIIVDLNNLNF